jgi:hypothetical protein
MVLFDLSGIPVRGDEKEFFFGKIIIRLNRTFHDSQQHSTLCVRGESRHRGRLGNAAARIRAALFNVIRAQFFDFRIPFLDHN